MYGAFPPPQPGYGAPQQPAYGQPPPQPGYGAPQQPAYGQPPPQPSYGAPQQPAYGHPQPSPQQPAYGQPPRPQPGAYGQPQQPAYGAPQQQPAYGQPQQPAYGQPQQQQPAYGQPPQQPSYGQPQQQPPRPGPGGYPQQPQQPAYGQKGGYGQPQQQAQQPGMQPGAYGHQQPGMGGPTQPGQYGHQQSQPRNQSQQQHHYPATEPLKKVERSALSAWCPVESEPCLIALGTSNSAAPVINADFSYQETPTVLEFMKFDLSEDGQEMRTVASTKLEKKCLAMSWGGQALDQNMYPLGLLAVGHSENVVSIYDPNQITQSNGGDQGLIWSSSTNRVFEAAGAVQFHPHKSNVLAASARNCEVMVFNLNDARDPEIHKQTGQTKMQGDIIDLAWNNKVPGILSSAASNGVTAIWDLKAKQICSHLQDPSNRTHISGVCWSPEVATQLILSYDDDRMPGYQLWDLRNASQPLREIPALHSKGISKFVWNHNDPKLILSTGKDLRTICCTLDDGMSDPANFPESYFSPYCEFYHNVANFDIAWSPHLPGVFSTSCMTHGIGIHSCLTATQKVSTSSPGIDLFTPKWYANRPCCGASFGFGGKIVQFGQQQGSNVSVHVIPSEPDIVASADSFEGWVRNGNWKDYCTAQVGMQQGSEQRLWDFMSIHINTPEDAAKQMVIEKLGFSRQQIEQQNQEYLGKPSGSIFQELSNQQQAAKSAGSAPGSAIVKKLASPMLPALNDGDAEQFFHNMASKTQEQELEAIKSKETALASSQEQQVEDSCTNDWTQGPEYLVKQNFLIGQRVAALEILLQCGRVTDALLLSYTDPQLFELVKNKYLQEQKDSFLNTISSVVKSDLSSVVDTCDLKKNWRETLAILATYSTNSHEWKTLCAKLADRLEQENFDIESAVIVCVASRNFPKTIACWSAMTGASQNSESLQRLVEKMNIWFDVTDYQDEDPLFNMKLTQYASILANSGRMTSAMRQLSRLKNLHDPETLNLRYRIYHSLPQQDMQLFQHPGQPPFAQIQIKGGGPAAVAKSAGPNTTNNMQQQRQVGPGAGGGPVPVTPGIGPQRPGVPGGPTPGGPMSMNPRGAPGNNMPVAPKTTAPNFAAQPKAPVTNMNPGMPPMTTQQQNRPNLNPMNPMGGPPQPQQPQNPAMGGPSGPGPVNNNMNPFNNPNAQQPQPGPFGGGPQPNAPMNQNQMNQMNQTQQQQQQGGPGNPGPGGPNGPNQPQQTLNVNAASTAPQRAAAPVVEGLPVPWPNPTAVQSGLHHNQATAGANAMVQGSGGIPNPWQASGSEKDTVKQAFQWLLEQGTMTMTNPKMKDDTEKRFGNLVEMIDNNRITIQTGARITEMAQRIQSGDLRGAKDIQAQLSSVGSFSDNKQWVGGVHRVFTELEKTGRMQ